ncbi:MAG: ribosomal subunit interface protein [Legionellales bacterium]|nr:ribosomal subunit interface protein [Legionellales bacterium]|tara:strand:- start:260 stop:559 length:300 start_codon:yes stop_codon:yes gene_type:complete
MKINITGRHVNITNAMQLHIENKFKKLESHFENIIDTHFILTVEKERMKAEALLVIKNDNLFAENESDNMYAAIDDVIDKLDRQLKKQKEKNKDYRRKD